MAAEKVSRPITFAGALAAAAGVMLFIWVIRHAGAESVLGGVKRIGAGIFVIVLLGGLRGLIRAVAWRFCLDPRDRPPVMWMFATYLVGDAIGNVTPFGFLVSEPSKVALVRRQIEIPASAAALAVENLFYGATVVLMLLAGTTAFLLMYTVPPALRDASLVTAAVALAVACAGGWALTTRRRVISVAAERLIRHGIAPRYLSQSLPRIREFGDRIFLFVDRRSGAVLPLLALEAAYHLSAILEIAFALWLILGTRPSLLTSFVLEYVNRTITVAFQFVPLWLGVDEAGTSLATQLLQLGPATGVALAIVRKARIVLWTSIGLALLPLQAASPQQ